MTGTKSLTLGSKRPRQQLHPLLSVIHELADKPTRPVPCASTALSPVPRSTSKLRSSLGTPGGQRRRRMSMASVVSSTRTSPAFARDTAGSCRRACTRHLPLGGVQVPSAGQFACRFTRSAARRLPVALATGCGAGEVSCLLSRRFRLMFCCVILPATCSLNYVVKLKFGLLCFKKIATKFAFVGQWNV